MKVRQHTTTKSSRKKLVKCEFCLNNFERDVKALDKPLHCKSCNGLSSAFTRLKSDSSKHDFYVSHIEKLKNHEVNITSKSNGFYTYRCKFCLREFNIRSDALYHKSTNSCKHCESIYNNFLLSDSFSSEREFFLHVKSKIRFDLIDVESTKQTYGYDPYYMPLNSLKPVIAKCGFCGSHFELKYNSFIKCRTNILHCKLCKPVYYSYLKSNDNSNPYDYYANFKSLNRWLNKSVINNTIDKFKYDPSNLTSSSKSIVVANCYFCKTDVNIQFRSFVKSNGVVSCSNCRGEKLKHSLINKYGVDAVNLIPEVVERMSDPFTNQLIEKILKNRYKIEFVREFMIKNYSFDFFIPSANLLIECQGDYFHNFKDNGYSGTARDRGKSTYIEKYTTHKLIWIWEHELHIGRLHKILDYHIYKITEPKIEIINLDEIKFSKINCELASEFLASYHYLGGFTNSSIIYGAYYDDKLICVCVYGGVTRDNSIKKINNAFNTKYTSHSIRELKRFCIRPNVSCGNLATFCLKQFSKMLKSDVPNINLILSFSDSTVCDVGTIYKADNWKKLNNTGNSYHYVDVSTGRLIHKKTIWDMAKKLKMKEGEFAKKINIFKVEEFSKSVFAKQLK